MINAIGPVWDGNEVWLLTAGGATFAAFPQWYATLFSGFYLPLLIILVALIVRGVCFEFRSKVDSPRWRADWDRAIFAGSALPALLWGVAFANIVRGVPLNAAHVYTGNLLTLLNWYGLLGGLVTLSLFTLHGAMFLGLQDHRRAAGPGPAHGRRDRRWPPYRWPRSSWRSTQAQPRQARHRHHRRRGRGRPDRRRGRRAARPGGLGVRRHRRHPGAGRRHPVRRPVAERAALEHLGRLQPDRRPTPPRAHYTLVVMSWVALIFTPIVLGYQGWSYWVFRKRLTGPADSAQASTRRRRPGRTRRSPSAGGREAAGSAAAALLGRGPRLPRGHRRAWAWPPPA